MGRENFPALPPSAFPEARNGCASSWYFGKLRTLRLLHTTAIRNTNLRAADLPLLPSCALQPTTTPKRSAPASTANPRPLPPLPTSVAKEESLSTKPGLGAFQVLCPCCLSLPFGQEVIRKTSIGADCLAVLRGLPQIEGFQLHKPTFFKASSSIHFFRMCLA